MKELRARLVPLTASKTKLRPGKILAIVASGLLSVAIACQS